MNTVKKRAGSGHTDKDKKPDSVSKSSRRTSTPPIVDKKEEKNLRHKTDSPSRTARRTSTPGPDKKDEPKDKLTQKTASPSKSRRISTPVGDKEKKEEPKDKQLKVDEPTAQTNGTDHITDSQTTQRVPIVVIGEIPIVGPTIVIDDDVAPVVPMVPAVPSTNGTSDHSLPVITEEIDNDDIFPELKYEEGSDDDDTEMVSDIRSSTRRSQVQVTRTPETPRPGSDKQTDKKENGDDKGTDAKDTKAAKGKEEATATDRKLRSADRATEKENGDHDDDGRRETNFSKSRVKVSPYRRAALHDSSTTANYTGNNTTMEMDITESSIVSETSNNSSVRGRKSYKSLKPVKFERPPTSAVTVVNTSAGKRLCGAVVGRKRKPDSPEAPVQRPDTEPLPDAPAQLPDAADTPDVKRQRRHLLDRVFSPFVAVSSTPEPRRKNAQIVGINSDLPLSAPLVTTDPEVIKVQPEVEDSTPIEVGTEARAPNRRCVVM